MKHLINSRTQTTHIGDKNGGQTDHFEKISPKIGINLKQNCIYVIIFISKISYSISFVKIFTSVCCAHFDGEPCSSNYDSNPEKVHVFRFPRNPEERIIWINSLPTKITANDDTVLCEKHQPADFGRVVKGHLDTGQSTPLVNSGQLQLLSYRKHQALSKGISNVEIIPAPDQIAFFNIYFNSLRGVHVVYE